MGSKVWGSYVAQQQERNWKVDKSTYPTLGRRIREHSADINANNISYLEDRIYSP